MSPHGLAFRWLVRTALLLFWSLVLWGGLLFVATLVEAARGGSFQVLARLLPVPGDSFWAWLNAVSVALALAMALVIGGLMWWARLPQGGAGPSEGPDEGHA